MKKKPDTRMKEMICDNCGNKGNILLRREEDVEVLKEIKNNRRYYMYIPICVCDKCYDKIRRTWRSEVIEKNGYILLNKIKVKIIDSYEKRA